MVAELFKDSAYDTVSSGVDFDAGLIAVGFGSVADCVGVDGSVFKFYAVGDALHVVFRDVFVGPNVVDFLLHVFGVSELGGEVAIVGKQKYAGGVAVESAYGVDAFFASVFDEIHYSETSVGVVGCGDAVFRLVEEDVALAFECYNLVIVFNGVVVRNLCSEFGDNFAVDFYESLQDVVVGFAA